MELFDKLWKSYNVSMILVLPLFKKLTERLKTKSNYKLNIQGIFHDAGMINTFLLNENGIYDSTLYVLFDKDSLLSYKLYDSKRDEIGSLLEYITSSEFYKDSIILNNKILISLHIDKIWEDDINKIINSEYSQVSLQYKEQCKYSGIYLKNKNKNINYLYISNMPAKILFKHKLLENLIKNLFKVPDIELPEIYKIFSIEEESITLKNLTSNDKRI